MTDCPSFDIAAAAAKENERFLALPETDQILYNATSKISSAYEVYDKAGKPREQVARDVLTTTYGPKFADRVLLVPAYRKMLRVDEPPVTSDTKTAETI